MAGDRPRVISRRDLLRGAAIAGAAVATTPGQAFASSSAAPAAVAAQTGQAAARTREPYEHLTAAEADTLEAIAARLIPTDAGGPGAADARAVRYIDRALGGALAGSREAYRAGLAGFDRYCRLSRGAPFVELPATDQDSVLVDVETGAATGSGAEFSGGSAQLFGLIKGHVWQGTFGDPYYGGNANFVGWDLIGYPGVRTLMSAADQQRLERGELKPNRRSAYDYDGFEKATTRAGKPGGPRHGD